MSSGLDASPCRARQSEPRARSSAARLSKRPGSERPFKTTEAPCRASAWAAAQPMPRVEPVTKATAPLGVERDPMPLQDVDGGQIAAHRQDVVVLEHHLESPF